MLGRQRWEDTWARTQHACTERQCYSTCMSILLKPSNQAHFSRTSPSIRALTINIDQGEISALENAGRLPASAYKGSTMYTTLSPCDMCSGACVLYKVSRVVMGENNTFVGAEEHLKRRGIEVVNLESTACEDLMKKFIKEHPEQW